MKPNSYSITLEIDRTLKLDLSNGQFEILADIIDSYDDSRKFANQLMAGERNVVLQLIMNAKKNI